MVGQPVYEVCRYEQANLSGSAPLYKLLAKTPDRGVVRIVVPSSRDLRQRCYGREKDGIAHPAARASFLHSDTKRDYRAFRDEDMRHGMAGLSVAKALLGYESRWRFHDELRRFLE